MESDIQILRRKHCILRFFVSFVRYKINSGTCSIIWAIRIYFSMFGVYLEKHSVRYLLHQKGHALPKFEC